VKNIKRTQMQGFTFLICDESGLVPVAAVLRKLANAGVRIFPFMPVPFDARRSHSVDGAGVPCGCFMLAQACGVTASLAMYMPLKAGARMTSDDYEKAADMLEDAEKAYLYDYAALVLDAEAGEWELELAGCVSGAVFLCGRSTNVKQAWDALDDDVRALVKGCLLSESGWSVLAKAPLPVIAVMPDRLPEAEILPDLCIFQNTEGFAAGVIRLACISDCNDTAPFLMSSNFRIFFINEPQEADACDLIIIPSSEDPKADLRFLEKRGFSKKLKEDAGTKPIISFGSGFSITGSRIVLKQGRSAEIISGLGLGDFESVVKSDGRLFCARFRFGGESGWLSHPVALSEQFLMAGFPFHGETAKELARNMLGTIISVKPDFSEYIIMDRALNILAERCEVREPLR
jgi:hypothetical protein